MTIEDQELEDAYSIEESIPDSHYLVMWCSEGLEWIIPLDMSKLNDGAEMLALLEDRENKYAKDMSSMFTMMKLRASANSQRNYEIYKLVCSGGITKEQLEHMFDTDPQSIVNLIREKGVKLYGERLGKRTQVII